MKKLINYQALSEKKLKIEEPEVKKVLERNQKYENFKRISSRYQFRFLYHIWHYGKFR